MQPSVLTSPYPMEAMKHQFNSDEKLWDMFLQEHPQAAVAEWQRMVWDTYPPVEQAVRFAAWTIRTRQRAYDLSRRKLTGVDVSQTNPNARLRILSSISFDDPIHLVWERRYPAFSRLPEEERSDYWKAVLDGLHTFATKRAQKLAATAQSPLNPISSSSTARRPSSSPSPPPSILQNQEPVGLPAQDAPRLSLLTAWRKAPNLPHISDLELGKAACTHRFRQGTSYRVYPMPVRYLARDLTKLQPVQ